MHEQLQTIHTTPAALDQIINQLRTLPADKLSHCVYTFEALLDCYINEHGRALVLLGDSTAERERISLIAVNADEAETQELIDNLCVFRQMDFADPSAMN